MRQTVEKPSESCERKHAPHSRVALTSSPCLLIVNVTSACEGRHRRELTRTRFEGSACVVKGGREGDLTLAAVRCETQLGERGSKWQGAKSVAFLKTWKHHGADGRS
eukprot:3511736-Pleurochrysis_carterae.AAC.2